jgi:hypothetical protein
MTFIQVDNSDFHVANMAKLKRCMLYARAAMADKTVKEYYQSLQKKSQTAFNVAFIDAYYAPKITALRFDLYRGMAGDLIRITSTDKYKVTEVMVNIIDLNEKLVECGYAIRQTNHGQWLYTATKTITKLPGTTVRVTAIDVPQNRSIIERYF